MKMNDETKKQLMNERQLALDRLVLSNCMNQVTELMVRRNDGINPVMYAALEKTLTGLCEMWNVIEPECIGGLALRADDEVIE